MTYGLIGEKLGHSFSKEIHEMLGYGYELKELNEDEVKDFICAREFCGINVTIPYKQTVIPFLDEMSDSARITGTVNTVIHKSGKLIGYNTDLDGLISLIYRITGGSGINGKTLILGSGATSRTAVEAAKRCGATEVVRVSRSGKGDLPTYPEAEKYHSDAEFIINCTPCGMYPHGDDELLLDIDKFGRLKGIADCVYNPLRTHLVMAGIERGISAQGGLYMLVSQAIAAGELFSGRNIPQKKTDEIYEKLLKSKENIILIGMPSCGKTTVGKKLSFFSGKFFADTDTEIEKSQGKTVSEIFAQNGESRFREIERKIISELSSQHGMIIATGGGAVLDKSNVDTLKSNGKIFFIDRSVENLMPSADRPLASDRTSLGKLFDERYGLYKSSADVIIDGNGTPDEVAERIQKYM